jgi:uncharacterized membrane protein YphA (DoxX/SURF4 family)
MTASTIITTRERGFRLLLALALAVVVWRLGSSNLTLEIVEYIGAGIIALVALGTAVVGRSPSIGGLADNNSLAFIAARLFVGAEFLHAGWEKLTVGPGWVGASAGQGVKGFLGNAVSAPMTSGAHASVPHWFAAAINQVVLPNTTLMSYLIVFGELAVGAGLILGIMTRAAAGFGGLMNLAFLLAGSTGGGKSPMMLTLEVIILVTASAGVYAATCDRAFAAKAKDRLMSMRHRHAPVAAAAVAPAAPSAL